MQAVMRDSKQSEAMAKTTSTSGRALRHIDIVVLNDDAALKMFFFFFKVFMYGCRYIIEDLCTNGIFIQSQQKHFIEK